MSYKALINHFLVNFMKTVRTPVSDLTGQQDSGSNWIACDICVCVCMFIF